MGVQKARVAKGIALTILLAQIIKNENIPTKTHSLFTPEFFGRNSFITVNKKGKIDKIREIKKNTKGNNKNGHMETFMSNDVNKM